MSSDKEYQWHNPLPALKNTTAMRPQANIAVSNAGIVQNLASLFRGIDEGALLTLQADGAKVYYALGSNDVGQTLIAGLTGYTIEADRTGNGLQICQPIPDGVMVPVIPYGGNETGSTGTMAPTMARYTYLHARVASGGVATAYLRLYRSSLPQGKDAGFFRPV